ncbi:MAG: molybdate ABC transporter substrate-binding protein [Pseudomonadota bacterium]
MVRHAFADTLTIMLARVFLTLFCLACAVGARAEPILVFAAASTKAPLDELAAAFMEQGGAEVVISYAGSSALARQIEHGAPADLFLSANVDWVEYLDLKGRLDPERRFDLASNSLVLVTQASSAQDSRLQDIPVFLGEGRLAMAFVEAVPAGIYGKAALTSLGYWNVLKDRVVETDSVRAALALVALGEARLGLVYATDAIAEPRVAVFATIPQQTHADIRYVLAQVVGADPRASAFAAFLISPDGQEIFAAHGFLPAQES